MPCPWVIDKKTDDRSLWPLEKQCYAPCQLKRKLKIIWGFMHRLFLHIDNDLGHSQNLNNWSWCHFSPSLNFIKIYSSCKQINKQTNTQNSTKTLAPWKSVWRLKTQSDQVTEPPLACLHSGQSTWNVHVMARRLLYNPKLQNSPQQNPSDSSHAAQYPCQWNLE